MCLSEALFHLFINKIHSILYLFYFIILLKKGPFALGEVFAPQVFFLLHEQ